MFKLPALVLAASLIPSLGSANPPVAVEKPSANGSIMVRKQGTYTTLTPEGKQLSEFTPKPGVRKFAGKERNFLDKYVVLSREGKGIEIQFPDNKTLTDPSFSPDGKSVAFIAPDFPAGHDRDLNFLHSVFVCKLDGKGEGTTIELQGQNLAWTPEGKLIAVEAASMHDVRDRKFTTWLVDVGTKEKTKLDIPDTAQIYTMTPDGKSYIATTYDFDKKQFHIVSISRDGNKVSQLTPLGFGIMSPPNFINPKLSPDGSRILFLDVDREEKLEKGMLRFPRLYLYDMKTKKREKLADLALDAFIGEYAWSPDSKKVAYLWKRMEAGVPLANSLDKDGKPKEGKVVETETHLNVSEPNGKNSKTILSAKGANGPVITLLNLEWR